MVDLRVYQIPTINTKVPGSTQPSLLLIHKEEPSITVLQILKTLNVLHSDLKNQVVTFTESRIFNELKAKIRSIKEFKEKLLLTLGDFLEDHFPLPDKRTQKKRKNIQDLNPQLITLNEMLEMLINRMFDVPHDPYVKINDSFWPPYIELLLRYGIALRHPEDPSRIRLEAFHQ